MTVPLGCSCVRLTGNPQCVSHRWTVRTPLSMYCAIAFQDVKTCGIKAHVESNVTSNACFQRRCHPQRFVYGRNCSTRNAKRKRLSQLMPRENTAHSGG